MKESQGRGLDHEQVGGIEGAVEEGGVVKRSRNCGRLGGIEIIVAIENVGHDIPSTGGKAEEGVEEVEHVGHWEWIERRRRKEKWGEM